MTRLSARDLNQVLSAVRWLHEPTASQDFPAQVIAAIRLVIDCDLPGYTELELSSQQCLARTDDVAAQQVVDELAPTLLEFSQEHPLIRFFAEQGHEGVVKVSDFLTRAQWESSGIYREIYRHLSANAQMVAEVVAGGDHIIGAIVNRAGRDFSERERCKLRMLQMHLKIAYRNWEVRRRLMCESTRASHVFRALEYCVFTIDGQGHITEAQDDVRQRLGRWFPGWSSLSKDLPAELMAWVIEQMQTLCGVSASPAGSQLRPSGCGQPLVARLLRDVQPERFVLVVYEQASPAVTNCSEALGLTPREAEVMYWVAQGKTNRQIGKLLHISHRTVQNHLAHCFEKLRVDSRTLAARKVFGLQPGCLGNERT
jgi:DNA-binding CsgD family transcriptional regulator